MWNVTPNMDAFFVVFVFERETKQTENCATSAYTSQTLLLLPKHEPGAYVYAAVGTTPTHGMRDEDDDGNRIVIVIIGLCARSTRQPRRVSVPRRPENRTDRIPRVSRTRVGMRVARAW